MAIPKWRHRSNTVTAERFLTMELPLSRVGENGVLADSVTVEIFASETLLLYAEVARDKRGYHYDMGYETLTGGAMGPVCRKDPVCPEKLDVLRGVICQAMGCCWITKHPGNGRLLERAMERLKRQACIQLTLF